MRYHHKPDGTNVPFTPEEEAQWDAIEAAALLVTPAELHLAAYSYIEARIDSQARDAVMMALMTGTPVNSAKVHANQAWLQSIWGDPANPAAGSYYAKKAALAAGNLVSLDFSGFGDPPFSFRDVIS